MQVLKGDEKSQSAYQRGLADGIAASGRKAALTAYLRVGIDDYARGYRSGFYARQAASIEQTDPYDRLAQKSA